jgi:hypothetical protein
MHIAIAKPALPRCALQRLVPSWPLLVGSFAFAIAIARSAQLLIDPDTYLHIAAGRWMLVHRMLPASDPFSYSMAGAPWTVHEWLSELLLAVAYERLQWTGVVLLTAACFGLGIALLMRRLLEHGNVLTSLLLALGASHLLTTHLLARPHLLALPVMVAWCGAIIAARDARRAPPFAILPLMTLWANLHGSFMVGLGLTLFLGLEAVLDRGAAWRLELRRWSAFAALAILAAMLDPNGPDGFLLPIRLMDMPVLQGSFREWLSPDFHGLQPLELWLLGLLAAGLGLRLKLPPLRLLFVLLLVHLSLQAMRHSDLLAVLVPLLVSAPFGLQINPRLDAQGPSLLRERLRMLARPAAWPAVAMAAAFVVAIGLARLSQPIERSDAPDAPISALAAEERMALPGPVFNTQMYGGYLMFKGVPTFIDGRAEMYGADFTSRYLAAAEGNEAMLTALLDRYRVGWTLLVPYSGAALVMKRLPGWQRVYSDAYAVIDQRIGGSN